MFLYNVIADIYKRKGEDMKNVTIIFPNKRAGLFANQYLSDIAQKPVWAPQYTTITEFFSSLSDKKVPDGIELVMYLYKAYQQSNKHDKYTFDQFYNWGEILLNDFQDIDNNMVNAQSLFDNASALETLNRTDYLDDSQLQAIRTFFADYDVNDKNLIRKRFIDMWNNMYDLYTLFRTSLANDGLAYEAMQKREVVENLNTVSSLDNRTFAIIGFNVLNETERQLFLHLKANTETYFYWDYNPNFIHHEASAFIEENIKLFPNALLRTQSVEDSGSATCKLSSTPNITSTTTDSNNIQIYSASSDTAQCSFAYKWLTEHITDSLPLNSNALILADENLLQTSLHSLPDVPINITMGFPLRQTPIASYVQSLCKKHIRCNDTNDSESLLTFLIETVKQIGKVNKKSDPLTIESIFTTYELLCRIKSVIYENTKFPEIKDDIHTLLPQLILNLISSKSIPFHGEPATGMQVMGMLETRNLDFKNIVILSVNEGVLPKISNSNSFIPYFLRSSYNMTTVEKQTSLYAYYFYRLLQRADNVALVYNNSTEGLKKGEMSRFLIQLQLERKVQVQTLTSPNLTTVHRMTSVEKKPQHMDDMLSKLNYTFSPSALKTYIQCPLQFFFKYVSHITPQDNNTDEVEDSTFGTIIHEVLKDIYTPYIGQTLTASQIESLAKDKVMIEQLVDKQFEAQLATHNTPANYTGEQYLNRFVILKYINNQLHHDATLSPIKIIALEQDARCTIIQKPHPIKLGGRIDRIDNIAYASHEGSITRIVDYKTSSKQQTTNSIESLFTNSGTDHIFQAFCYAEMLICTQLTKDTEPQKFSNLAPALNYIKLVGRQDYDSCITLPGSQRKRTPVLDYQGQCHTEFKERLSNLVSEILNTNIPFHPTDNEKTCEYCPYLHICNKDNNAKH